MIEVPSWIEALPWIKATSRIQNPSPERTFYSILLYTMYNFINIAFATH